VEDAAANANSAAARISQLENPNDLRARRSEKNCMCITSCCGPSTNNCRKRGEKWRYPKVLSAGGTLLYGIKCHLQAVDTASHDFSLICSRVDDGDAVRSLVRVTFPYGARIPVYNPGIRMARGR